MDNSALEMHYPITFRKEDAAELGSLLNNRHSVILIGMPRVGISNFLRFFLYHEDVVRTYIHTTDHHIFIPVDLNDLVEREIYPFWVLTLKRIADTAAISITLPARTKKDIEDLFLQGIQTKDLFLVIDTVRKSLLKIIAAGLYPTIFFIRFDRLQQCVTPELFANLEGLKDAMHQKLSYVFTGSRSLDYVLPGIFSKSSISVFSKNMFIKPAEKKDALTIIETYKNQYHLWLSSVMEETVYDLSDGYVQYLQLVLIYLQQHKIETCTKESLLEKLLKDEQIYFQSEELFENFTGVEQQILRTLSSKKPVTQSQRSEGEYLWQTGCLTEKDQLFSPLFAAYVLQKESTARHDHGSAELSKKEHMLFSFLQENKDTICEREAIIEHVWPTVAAFGVSDWAIDRLVARVRQKLKVQKSPYKIQTVKTRGYKLVENRE